MKFTNDQLATIKARFLQLPEAKREKLRKFLYSSEEAKLLRAIIGPEFMTLVAATKQPKRGIAAPR